jgi:hypothetical protein
MEQELRNTPDVMAVRSRTVEHPFGTLKAWMGSTHFLMKRLQNVRTEMSLHVLAYNLRRMISIIIGRRWRGIAGISIQGGWLQRIVPFLQYM